MVITPFIKRSRNMSSGEMEVSMGKSSIEMVVCNFKISLISDRHMDIEPHFLSIIFLQVL